MGSCKKSKDPKRSQLRAGLRLSKSDRSSEQPGRWGSPFVNSCCRSCAGGGCSSGSCCCSCWCNCGACCFWGVGAGHARAFSIAADRVRKSQWGFSAHSLATVTGPRACTEQQRPYQNVSFKLFKPEEWKTFVSQIGAWIADHPVHAPAAELLEVQDATRQSLLRSGRTCAA